MKSYLSLPTPHGGGGDNQETSPTAVYTLKTPLNKNHGTSANQDASTGAGTREK